MGWVAHVAGREGREENKQGERMSGVGCKCVGGGGKWNG